MNFQSTYIWIVMNYPLVYILFIGGAADKEPFLWQKNKLPFDKFWTHHLMGDLALSFNQTLLKKLDDKNHSSAGQLGFKIDYLSYTEVFFEELKDCDFGQHFNSTPSCQRYQSIKQNIGENTKVYIIGHSLGGWNGAHLSHILSQMNIAVECLITLDPVGTGNHEVTLIHPWIKKAQIYLHEPIPIAKYWFNIQAIHIHLAKKRISWFLDDWIAWAGGQWLISQRYPSVEQQINTLTSVSHKSVDRMFNYPTQLGLSAHDFLLNTVIDTIRKN